MFTTTAMIAIAIACLLTMLRLWRANRRLHADLSAARTQLQHDRLTGLLNRDGLTDAHRNLVAAGHPLITVLADVDDFKTVNDTYGHHVGDELLTVVAERVGEIADLYQGGAARLGGDEFAAVLPAAGHDPHRVADTFRSIISQPAHLTHGLTLNVTVSVGYTVTRTDLTASLRAADVAMYHTKRAGAGQPTGYRTGMTIPAPAASQRRRLRDRSVTE